MLSRFLRLFCRQPDFVIGSGTPYMHRWYVIPRNRWFNIYLHKILRDDDDRALHDHPWWNVSLILSGSYREKLPHGQRIVSAGSVVLRRPDSQHRIELVNGKPCWTLFITGPRVREWGFWCPQGFVHWKVFTASDDYGKIGKGCNQ